MDQYSNRYGRPCKRWIYVETAKAITNRLGGFVMLKKIRRGIKHFMKERVQVCKEVLSNAENRLVLGLILLGTGGGLVASAYIRVPS